MREYPKVRQWEPVPHWLPANRSLLMQIESELRERVAPCESLIGGYALVSPGKHNGLKNDAVDFVYVLDRETNNVAKPAAVPAPVYRDLRCGSHSGGSNVLQGVWPHLHIVSWPTIF